MKTRHRFFRAVLWFAAFGLLGAAYLSISDGQYFQATLDVFGSAIMFQLLWFGRVPAAEKTSTPTH